MGCPEIPGDSPKDSQDPLDLPEDFIVIVPGVYEVDGAEGEESLAGDPGLVGDAPAAAQSHLPESGIQEAPEDADLAEAVGSWLDEIAREEPAEPSPESRAGRPPSSFRRKLARIGALTVSVTALGGFMALLSFSLQQGFLAAYFPSPGRLSAAHEISDLEADCFTCHDPTGMERACLECHEEIWIQLTRHTGYHDYLLDGKDRDCARCHIEHLGTKSQLVSALSWAGQDRENFAHPHVEFSLEGKHDDLDCEECHEKKLKESFTLPDFPSRPREHTHLGLEQECVSCHEDIHSDGLSSDCASCHGQDGFRPATHFDHDRHFPLVGGHERVECAGCHEIPDRTGDAAALLLPFDRVRGTRCLECHESPHRTWRSLACETCHTELLPRWNSAQETMTSDLHALTGFELAPPHEQVECEGCHEGALPYEDSHPDPSLPGYLRGHDSCQGCHEDAHGGQFTPTHTGCLDCHDRLAFEPHHFDLQRHASVFPLSAPHTAVPCTDCHTPAPGTEVRVFTSTSRECKSCHEDPHGGQFADSLAESDCTVCHDDRAETFAIRDFDHTAATTYPLLGAHAKARCNQCHLETESPPSSGLVRMFRGTSRDCSSCHVDVHRGQFRKGSRTLCTDCHHSTSQWRETVFDHNTQSRFALDGKHVDVSCDRCHPRVRLPDGGDLLQFKPLGTECKDCHEVPGGEATRHTSFVKPRDREVQDG